jgi:predicted transcriptional regulator
MYKANVSWSVMQDFLDMLESQALISAVPERSGHKKYALTDKGMECLRTVLEAKTLLGESEDS